MLEAPASPDQGGPGPAGPRPDDPLSGLVRPAVAGDRGAMRELLKAVAPLVARAVRRVMGRGHPDLEDVAQQVLSGFVERLPSFRGESSVSHFVERIALYRALTARRDADLRGRLVVVVSGEELERSAPDGMPAEVLDTRDRVRGALLDALDGMPPAQAEALALHFLFDHTVPEIAIMLGAPQETVRSRLRHGKRLLRARIEADRRLADLWEDLR